MKSRNPDTPTYAILVALRDTQKRDAFYVKQQDRLTARKHAFVASRNRQAALNGLKKMKELR